MHKGRLHCYLKLMGPDDAGSVAMLGFGKTYLRRWRVLPMKKKRFSLEQIAGVLKQAEVGMPVVEVIREAWISEQTLHRWMLKYVGLEVGQVRQMKLLRKENLRLQQLMAELTLGKVSRRGSIVGHLARR